MKTEYITKFYSNNTPSDSTLKGFTLAWSDKTMEGTFVVYRKEKEYPKPGDIFSYRKSNNDIDYRILIKNYDRSSFCSVDMNGQVQATGSINEIMENYPNFDIIGSLLAYWNPDFTNRKVISQ